MQATDITILESGIKNRIKLTIPGRSGKTTFVLKGIIRDKRMANKYAYELRKKNPNKVVKVMERTLRNAKTNAVYITQL